MPALRSLTPYLAYPDVATALDWLEPVLGTGRRRTSAVDGVVMEGELVVGGVSIMLSGRPPQTEPYGAGAVFVIRVDDVDAQHAQVRAAVGDAYEVTEPKDAPYGPRTFDLTDPWGYTWSFWQGDADYD